jgi:hypothetical protein
MHDCRRDSEALLQQHGIRLEHVFDTQAAFAVLRLHTAKPHSMSRVAPEGASLSHLARKFLGHGGGAKENVSSQMSADPHYWAARPLSTTQLRRAEIRRREAREPCRGMGPALTSAFSFQVRGHGCGLAPAPRGAAHARA